MNPKAEDSTRFASPNEELQCLRRKQIQIVHSNNTCVEVSPFWYYAERIQEILESKR